MLYAPFLMNDIAPASYCSFFRSNAQTCLSCCLSYCTSRVGVVLYSSSARPSVGNAACYGIHWSHDFDLLMHTTTWKQQTFLLHFSWLIKFLIPSYLFWNRIRRFLFRRRSPWYVGNVTELTTSSFFRNAEKRSYFPAIVAACYSLASRWQRQASQQVPAVRKSYSVQ